MNNADLKAVNDFGAERIRPTTRTVALPVADNAFAYVFPKHSLTILRLKVQ
jgi:alpha-L-arabinofuranosidase